MIETLHQVLKRLAAPVAADGVGECLPETGRAMKVDRNHRVPSPGERLRVPAIVKMIFDRALRTAVNDKCDRILLSRFKANRLENPGLYFFAARPREREFRGLARSGQLDGRIRDVGKLLNV